MRVLFRVAAALLIAIPVYLVLANVLALAGKRGTALPLGEQGFPPVGEKSLAWLLAARRRKDYRRIPIVASISVPGVPPSVVVTFRSGSKMRVETRIDGGVTLPFCIAPALEDLSHSMAGGRLTSVEPEALFFQPLIGLRRAISLDTNGRGHEIRTKAGAVKTVTAQPGFLNLGNAYVKSHWK